MEKSSVGLRSVRYLTDRWSVRVNGPLTFLLHRDPFLGHTFCIRKTFVFHILSFDIHFFCLKSNIGLSKYNFILFSWPQIVLFLAFIFPSTPTTTTTIQPDNFKSYLNKRPKKLFTQEVTWKSNWVKYKNKVIAHATRPRLIKTVQCNWNCGESNYSGKIKHFFGKKCINYCSKKWGKNCLAF